MPDLRAASERASLRPRGSALSRRTLMVGAGAGFAALSLGGASLLHGRPALAAPQIDQPAPEFDVTDTNGASYRLADLRGKVVVLEWTNADCPYVRKHYGSSNMQDLQREATAAGIVWLSVISSAPGTQGHVSAEEANRLTESRGAAPSGVVLDPEGTLGRAYEAKTTPHMYVIDQAGVLRYMGGIDSIPSKDVDDLAEAEPYLKNAFLAVASGQKVTNAVTRPYGCSVKYSS